MVPFCHSDEMCTWSEFAFRILHSQCWIFESTMQFLTLCWCCFVQHLIFSVTFAAKLQLLKLPKQIELLQNISYVLQCNVLSAQTTPTFTWKRGSTTLTNSDKVKIDNLETLSLLKLKNLQRNDSGSYTCIASSGHSTDSTTTALQILGNFITNLALEIMPWQ